MRLFHIRRSTQRTNICSTGKDSGLSLRNGPSHFHVQERFSRKALGAPIWRRPAATSSGFRAMVQRRGNWANETSLIKKRSHMSHMQSMSVRSWNCIAAQTKTVGSFEMQKNIKKHVGDTLKVSQTILPLPIPTADCCQKIASHWVPAAHVKRA